MILLTERRLRRLAVGEPALVVRKAAHGALAKVTEAIEKLHFNVGVAHIYEFANALGSAVAKPAPTPDFAWAMGEAASIMVRLFHPMMPHLAEECWAALGHTTLVAEEPWPAVEAGLLVENTITLPVQVNGKRRAEVTVPREAASAPSAMARATGSDTAPRLSIRSRGTPSSSCLASLV